jgi:hypothetical protein
LLKNKQYKATTVLSHAHAKIEGKALKYWIVDVDDLNVGIDSLCESINACTSGFSNNIVAALPTKNGYHLITHPFNQTQITLPPDVEIKKNVPTLLYFP